MPESSHPYNRPSDPAKRHSAALTDGPDRAGARSMLKAIGFTDDDLAKPLVGVGDDVDRDHALQLQPAAARGVRQGGHPGSGRHADGVQHHRRERRRVDGHRGDEGVADQPRGDRGLDQLVVRGHLLDGVVCLVGCDKTIPAAAMALGRLDVPGLVLYNGTIYPGTYQGVRNATVVTVYEAIGAYRAGKITLDELYEIENVSCPGPGACGGQYTANTMSTVMEFIGLSPGGLNGIPAEDPAKDEAARRSGELVMDLVRRDARPSSFVTRQALENGIASVAATGGSTNGVLHLLAIAHEFGNPARHRRLRDDRRAHASSPTCGRAAATPHRTCTTRAASGLVMRQLLKRDGLLHGARAVDGRTIARSPPTRRRPRASRWSTRSRPR